MRYNVWLDLGGVNNELHFRKIREYLSDKARIQDLMGLRFKVRFDNEEEVNSFFDFLNSLEPKKAWIFIRVYHGKKLLRKYDRIV